MSVDEQLLAANNQKEDSSGERAGALREQKRSEQEPNPGGDLRSRVMKKRKEKASKKLKLGGENRKSISFRKSLILKENILNLVTSFGLTFFYIVYHWFQSKVGNKRKYVKLGSEWMDMPGMTEKQRDEIGSNFAPWENCCFVSASLGCLVVIVLAMLPFVLIGYYISHPAKFAIDLPQMAWNVLKSIFPTF